MKPRSIPLRSPLERTSKHRRTRRTWSSRSRQATLLFDERKSPAVLVGFAYCLQSATKPVGFAGDNDVWHQHTGLCVVNGWLDRRESVGHEDCAGTLFQGGDLWMLHAWVVDKYKNRDVDFAVFNSFLCPSGIGPLDDLLCPH